MAQAPPTSDKLPARKGPLPELPPEEQFWQRYSPHHEFPLSSLVALATCAAAFAAVVVLTILHANRQDELQRPPRMDAVEIEGLSGGTDGPGPGVGFGPSQGAKTEVADSGQKPTPATQPPSTQAPQLKDVEKAKPLDVPVQTAKAETGDPTIFDQIRVEAEKQVRDALQAAPTPKPAPVRKGDPKSKSNSPNPGTGGGIGGGTGPGFGQGQGPGMGNNKFGQVLTVQQKHEMRWRIKFITADGHEHLEQLRALRITLALPTPQAGTFNVLDLTRRPPVGKLENLQQQRDKVKWINTDPPSLQRLAMALRLPQMPQFAVIFLPPEMEETLSRLEHAFAGRPEYLITLTEFEIRRGPDGSYVPIVTSQH
jgi:hypothetical protein